MRDTMFYTVIISNISFLVSLLLSMLFYLEVGEKETHKRAHTSTKNERSYIQ